jgi:hypothetical protein
MLEFRPRVPARNYLSRREQWRLLAWVLGIGLLVMGGLWFRDIYQLVTQPGQAAAPPIDTRFHPNETGSSESDSVTIAASREPAASSEGDAGGEVDAGMLHNVRDDTPWIRDDEIEAWLKLWAVLRKSSNAELARDSTGEIGFVELFGQPRAYRGKLVTIRGSARQAVYLEAAKNNAAVEGYYRVVLQPASGPAEPVFVYALELPADFPRGERIRAEVTATGYFFKRMVYSTNDAELRRAPVIMARTLGWQRPNAQIAEKNGLLVSILIGATAIGIIAFFLVSTWASRGRASARAPRLQALPPLDDSDVVDVHRSLARLAENQE